MRPVSYTHLDVYKRQFETLRRELPMGYVLFHLPWVEEWYVANRQYRQAWQLMRDFPEYRR